MAKQTIICSPANSGTGDTLSNAFVKTNANFTELYNNVATISGSTVKTKTSEFINDGSDALHPFITAQSIPSSYPMSAITGLNTSIANLQTQINTISGNVTTNTSSINTINSQISTINQQIGTINLNIAQIQADITNIYSIIQ